MPCHLGMLLAYVGGVELKPNPPSQAARPERLSM